MIFESDDPNARWDGTDGGQLGKQDVYVYRFRVKDHTGRWHTFDGHVALLK